MTDRKSNFRRRIVSMFRRRTFWAGLALAGAAGVFAANAHLVIVAVNSQPNCVPHHKEPAEAPGAYRAAKSSCTWRDEVQK